MSSTQENQRQSDICNICAVSSPLHMGLGERDSSTIIDAEKNALKCHHCTTEYKNHKTLLKHIQEGLINIIGTKSTNDIEQDLNICSICLDNIEYIDIHKPYQCNHIYHEKCSDLWNRSCPECRAEKIHITLTNNNNNNNNTRDLSELSDESITAWKQSNSSVPIEFHNIYRQTWKKDDCLRYNHNIVFLKPYGVVGICEHCKITQCFNLSHPVNF
jgi:hypothetical protein